MASIVEKETGIAEERKRVASVFVNRLQQGMRLQTDPTVIYGDDAGRGRVGARAAAERIAARDAVEHLCDRRFAADADCQSGAVVHRGGAEPRYDSDYIFFVADGTGGHAFGRTLEEHNENVARWRAIEAERGEEAATGVQD
jgi:UPF0755 protein